MKKANHYSQFPRDICPICLLLIINSDYDSNDRTFACSNKTTDQDFLHYHYAHYSGNPGFFFRITIYPFVLKYYDNGNNEIKLLNKKNDDTLIAKNIEIEIDFYDLPATRNKLEKLMAFI